MKIENANEISPNGYVPLHLIKVVDGKEFCPCGEEMLERNGEMKCKNNHWFCF